MRQYAWYCMERDCVVFQTIMEGCQIAYEWPFGELYKIADEFGVFADPMEMFTFRPLGEL